MAAYKLTSDTVASAIASDGSEGAVRNLPAGTELAVNGMSASDVLTAMAKGGTVSGATADGQHYAVPASSLEPVEAVSAQALYLAVGIAAALVIFMFWNTNRK